MQTECPHCHTVFRVAKAQLEMADGMVRCGFCKETFDARSVNDFAGHKNRQHKLSDTQPPEVRAKNEPGHDSFFSAEHNDIVADELGAGSVAKPYSAFATAAWSLAILVLIAALIIEYLWFYQPELLQDERLKPVTAKLCELIDCEHQQMRDPSQIEMISRNVYTHPNEKQALMVSTTMVNHASYAQPFPEVQIDFSNVRGEMIASRRFTPEEYLQLDKQQLYPLQSGTPVTFGLEIKDPGNQAITYEFSFH